jgi:hypothetical protein
MRLVTKVLAMGAVLIATLAAAALAATEGGPAPMGLAEKRPVPLHVGPRPSAREGGLHLPVQLAPAISSQPAKAGEVFFIRRLSLEYRGGPVTLAGDADGASAYSVDDQLTLRVTHPDGTTSQFQDGPEAEEVGPVDISSHFEAGVNQVEVELRDVFGDLEAATEVWLSDRGSAPPSVPRLPASTAPRSEVPLRLPVRLVQAMAVQPTKHDPLFYTTHFLLEYRGGPVTLAADAGGTRDSVVDDQLTLRITHPDGTTAQYQDAPYADWVAPMDLAKYFQVGVNRVEVELRDFGDVSWSTDVWLSDHAQAPARLPLELFAGETPQSYWPAKETIFSVTGLEEDREVMLAGDPRGRRGTWATGSIQIEVTRADGTVKTFTREYPATGDGPEVLPPQELTSLFGPGRNRVEVHLDAWESGVLASSPIWLARVQRAQRVSPVSSSSPASGSSPTS